MWFSVALVKFNWFGINWQDSNQSECRNCCLYIIIQKIEPQAKSGKYFQIWFSPRFGGKNGGVLSMRMQVILDSSFARPGSALIWGGKKGEFRDWTRREPDKNLSSPERIGFHSVATVWFSFHWRFWISTWLTVLPAPCFQVRLEFHAKVGRERLVYFIVSNHSVLDLYFIKWLGLNLRRTKF